MGCGKLHRTRRIIMIDHGGKLPRSERSAAW